MRMHSEDGITYAARYAARREIEALEREIRLLHETPVERVKRILDEQAKWDADLADYANLKARGYVVDFVMPPRPTV